MPELRLLGSLELSLEQGEPANALLAQPKRVALLAYLALEPHQGYRRRDSIVVLFWPDQDQEQARGSLRQAVRFLRRQLGDDAIINRGEEEIALNFARVRCDVALLAQAVDGGRMASLAGAVIGHLPTARCAIHRAAQSGNSGPEP